MRIINVTSKKTGIARINPAAATAYKTYLFGTACTIVLAITFAAPVSLINCPKITPNPIGKPIPAIILPKPVPIVSIEFTNPNPHVTPI